MSDVLNKTIEFLQDKISIIPNKPGCYIWLANKINIYGVQKLDQKDVLYIGKGLSLRNRVRSYLVSNNYKTQFLMKQAKDIFWIITTNEYEALLLENNLIKEFQPPYNIRLKDDKRYPYLCLTLGEMYPRVIITRRKNNMEHYYFGPYVNVRAARQIKHIIEKIFPIRKRNITLPKKTKQKPCLNYHLKRCWAPCTGEVDPIEYQEMISTIKNFLERKQLDVVDSLEKNMQEYSNNLEYEKAKRVRDILESVNKILFTEQRVEDSTNRDDIDCIALYQISQKALYKELDLDHFINEDQNVADYILHEIIILKVRKGKLIGKQLFSLNAKPLPQNHTLLDNNKDLEQYLYECKEECFESFFRDYYLTSRDIPEHIYISETIENQTNWSKNLTETANSSVDVNILSKKMKKKQGREQNQERFPLDLMQIAISNSISSLREKVLHEKKFATKIGLRQIKTLCSLKKLPEWIECYDISNFQGQHAVGSQVVLKNGTPYKIAYRKYKIKTIDTPNDPVMMYELLNRRLKKLKTNTKLLYTPDLIILDGGIMQLKVALSAQKSNNTHIPMISLAKREEEIYLSTGEKLKPDSNSPGMLILRLARDEAHRFAVNYHRNLRMKINLGSLFTKSNLPSQKHKKLLQVLRKLDLANHSKESLITLLKVDLNITQKKALEIISSLLLFDER